MCADCDSEKWAKAANEVLDSGQLSQSDETFLTGVVEWINDNKHATPAQIEKIREKADKVGIDCD